MVVPGTLAKIWWRVLLILTTLSLIFTTPSRVFSAEKYYYIHVGSFRAKKNAVRVAKGLQKKGYNAVVRGEQVANLGYWYRIYIGPFPSFQKAKVQSQELKKKGLATYTSVQHKDSLVRGDLDKRPKTAKARKEYIPPRKPAPPSPKKPATILAGKEKVPAAKKVPSPVSPMEKPREVKRPSSVVKAEVAPGIREKPPKKKPEFQRKGDGRNLAQGRFSIALQHTYREVPTELTDRTQITSDGVTTTKTNVSISSSEKNDFDTDMNTDMLRVAFGLTDYVQIFGDVGVSYDADDLDDMNLAYGGGARFNIFEVKSGSVKGLYAALQGEYHRGELETEYQSVDGNRFSKDADWWEFLGKGEVGLTRNRFVAYLGGTYFVYREDTDRTQLENLPVGLVSVKFEDDLEEEETFGAYGGVSIHLTPGFLINVEGQVNTQQSIAGTIEYRF